MSQQTRYKPCAGCGAPRPVGGRMKPDSVCRKCRRTKGWHAKHKATWNRAAAKKADKARNYPTTSWWTNTTREQFKANLAQRRPHMQAGGASGENV